MHVGEEVGQWRARVGCGAEVVDADVGEFGHFAKQKGQQRPWIKRGTVEE